MPSLKLVTFIKAPIDRCFDLSRSIDLHKLSTQHTKEEAISGTTSGLIELGETVTWRARHFGIVQTLTTEITAYNRPISFVDEMIEGAFKNFEHLHYFTECDSVTRMLDVFNYQSPFGIAGQIFDTIVLKRYMLNLLKERNRVIKEFAEEGRWKEVL